MFLVLLTTAFAGCMNGKSPEVYVIDDDTITGNMVLQGRYTESIRGMVSPQGVGIMDSMLLVIDRGERPVHFYTLQSLQPSGSLGGAKVSVTNPFYFNQYWKESDSTYFIIADAKTNRLLKFNAHAMLHDPGAAPEWSYRLPAELIMKFNSIFLTKDSSLIGGFRSTDIKNTGRFFVYDLRTKKMKWTKDYPSTTEKIAGIYLPYYYYSFCAFNRDAQVMASAMRLFKRIDLLGADGEIRRSIVFKSTLNYVPPAGPGGSQDASAPVFYNDAFGGEKYFYATCVNKSLNDYLANKGNMELQVFDWEGHLVKLLKLDRMYLGKFAVDEKNKKLYIVNFGADREQYPVLEYDLAPAKIF